MSFHNAISLTLVFGQILGLMPLKNVSSSNPYRLKMEWKSLRFLHFCVVTVGTFVYLFAISYWMAFNHYFSIDGILVFIIYLANFVTVILFFKIGRKWPMFVQAWSRVEQELPVIESFEFNEACLKHQMGLNLMFFIVVGVGELSLQSSSSRD